MKIISDRRMNPVLQKEVQELRGSILEQVEQNELSSRFKCEKLQTEPSMLITDTETDRQTIVPLFAYGEVRRILKDLFE